MCIKQFKCDSGFSLLAVALLLVAIGMIFVASAGVYHMWRTHESSSQTEQKLTEIQEAIQIFVTENGRYPCPAPLNSPIDDAAGTFGVETDCSTAAPAGTFTTAGRGGRAVRSGAIPVRTLGLPDEYIFDGHLQRYVYALTESYGAGTPDLSADEGGIRVEDAANQNVTNGNTVGVDNGNLVQIVFSMGDDQNGSYDVGGNQIQACDTTLTSGENCDFTLAGGDAVFSSSLTVSANLNDPFMPKFTYVPPRQLVTCSAPPGTAPPKSVSYIVDTSGSMNRRASGCPATLASNCSRMEVAHWALRRAIPTRISNNRNLDDPGDTSLTGFVAYGNTNNVLSQISSGGESTIVFDDPEDSGFGALTPADQDTYVEDKQTELESELSSMCGRGSTPLGIHVEAAAQLMEDGEDDRPNKIVILSDGESNNGKNPVTVARELAASDRNIQIDIIDVLGNPSLRRIAEETGGTYYVSTDPDSILDAINASSGLCGTTALAEPPDVNHCNNDPQ